MDSCTENTHRDWDTWIQLQKQKKGERENEQLSPPFHPHEVCQHCQHMLYLSEEGFYVCIQPDCGLLHQDVMDCRPEWRFYNNADDNQGSDPARCGLPCSSDVGDTNSYCCHMISYGGRGGGMSYHVKRIARQMAWMTEHHEQVRVQEYQRIRTIGQHAHVTPMIIDASIHLYKLIAELKQCRADNKTALLAGCMYNAYHWKGIMITEKEMATIWNTDTGVIAHGISTVRTLLDHLEPTITAHIIFPVITAGAFLQRYGQILHLPYEQSQLGMFLCHKIKEQNMMPSYTPQSMAAIVLTYVLLVCNNQSVHMEYVYEVTGTSKVTVDKGIKQLRPLGESMLPSTVKEKYSIGKVKVYPPFSSSSSHKKQKKE